MGFKIQVTQIPEVLVLMPDVYQDERGYFMEAFKTSEFRSLGIPDTFVQDNISFSKKGVLRGLHYQKHPHAQGKLVWVPKGRIWDVAVDLRRDSPTFKRWIGLELSSLNHLMLWIPEGFAHGFLALEEGSVVQYKCTREYNRDSERGIRYDDPQLQIEWPPEVLLISEKDRRLPILKEAWEQLF